MAGIEWLTCDHFAGRVGEVFRVVTGERAGEELVLVEATEGDVPGGAGPDGQTRLQFALVFRGPGPQVWPQGLVELTHADLGELQLFLVPMGVDAGTVTYEAAFA